jgi:hypothetical protein
MEALRILADLSASQWGIFTTSQATKRGVSRLDLARLVDAEQLMRITHGVYRGAGSPGDEFEDLRAVWLSIDPSRLAEDRISDGMEGVVVSGASAAWLYGVGDLRADPYEFTTPKRRQSQRSELRYRVRELDSSDVTIEGGLPVTTLERMIADLVEIRIDLSLVAGVVADAFQKRSLDLNLLASHLAPLATRNGFPSGDGDALAQHLMEIAGVDLDSIATEVAATYEMAPLITAKYLARLAEEFQTPTLMLTPAIQKMMLAVNKSFQSPLAPIAESINRSQAITNAPILKVFEAISAQQREQIAPMLAVFRALSENLVGLSVGAQGYGFRKTINRSNTLRQIARATSSDGAINPPAVESDHE